MEKFVDILGSDNWIVMDSISKGWSIDKKYYIETLEGKRLLLKTTDISQYEKKKAEFENLKLLANMNITMSEPMDFGVCNNEQLVYLLFTWVDGEDAELILPKLSSEKQYKLGIESGGFLKQIHEIFAPKHIVNWEERFNKKIDNKLDSYRNCGISFKGADKLIQYIEDNRHLLVDRPQTLQHGDYHIGNMVITPEGELGIIDFNRMDYGDPWEEFNRISFSAKASPVFASGFINGYFNNKVPNIFFRLLALYIANNQISSIPWAIPFGKQEVDTMIRYTKDVLDWYDDFNTYIPNWYIENFK